MSRPRPFRDHLARAVEWSGFSRGGYFTGVAVALTVAAVGWGAVTVYGLTYAGCQYVYSVAFSEDAGLYDDGPFDEMFPDGFRILTPPPRDDDRRETYSTDGLDFDLFGSSERPP